MDPTTGTAPQRSHEKRRYKEYLRNPETPVPKTTAWRNKKCSSSYTSHPSNERPYKQRKLYNIDCTMPVPRQTRWYWQKMDCNKQDDNHEVALIALAVLQLNLMTASTGEVIQRDAVKLMMSATVELMMMIAVKVMLQAIFMTLLNRFDHLTQQLQRILNLQMMNLKV